MENENLGSKYDRQLRLWDSSGQSSLRRSKICVVNVSSCITETVKNLILPGVGSVCIVDAGGVDNKDVSTNFFVAPDSRGISKSEAVSTALQELNPDVEVWFKKDTPLSGVLELEDAFWTQFNCVIYGSNNAVATVSAKGVERRLADRLWGLHIPLIRISSVGFYAYLTIQVEEQTIVETHENVNNLIDLRLDQPWPELQQYLASVVLPSDNPEYHKIPYSVILAKLYQSLQNEGGGTVKPSAVRNAIKGMYRTGDEPNLDEAYTKAYLVMKRSSDVSSDLLKLLQDRRTTHLHERSTLFWIMCNALKQFYDEFHILPLSGILPDMESDTAKYIKLKRLYESKFQSDKQYIKEKVLNILKGLDRPVETLDENQLTLFVRNCKFLKVIDADNQSNMKSKVLEVYKSTDRVESENALIYLAFIILETYVSEYKKYPNINDRSDLRNTAISMLCNDHEVKSFPEGLDKVLDEFCRANGHELHNISAAMGGIAAQEVIKILTKQYVPMDNCLTLDGISGKTHCLKL